jgi:amino acid permease
MRNKKFFPALAILIGVIIGAGIFGIPYVISRSGIIPSFFYFLILGTVILLLHLFFGEIVLRTKEKHRLIGYSKIYLGRLGEVLITISTLFGMTGALLAYLIIGGEFLEIIFSPILGFESSTFSLIFWAILSYFIFRGVRVIAKTEIITNTIFFLIVFIVFCFLLPKIHIENFTLVDMKNIFLPYGVIMFSLMGLVGVPEMVEILKTPEEKASLKKIIIISSIIVIILYLLFSLAVVGVSGRDTSPDTLSGLSPYLGNKIIILGALFGVITLADSFFVICLSLKNSLVYEYHSSNFLASLLSSGLPLILFLIGFRSFIGVIGLVGTILGMIDGVVILLIFLKIKRLGDREPEYSLNIPHFLIYFLIIIFILGAVFQLYFK